MAAYEAFLVVILSPLERAVDFIIKAIEVLTAREKPCMSGLRMTPKKASYAAIFRFTFRD